MGLKVDPSLDWKEQITTITSKISRGIGMLKYSNRYLPLHTIQRMYNSKIDPHIRYCCSVWGCAGHFSIKNCKSYKIGLLVLSNSPNDRSSLPLILQLGWLTVKEMIDFETAFTVYSVLKELAPSYLQ